jgi:hypothetical protein
MARAQPAFMVQCADMSWRLLRIVLLVVIVCSMSACGGGGAGSAPAGDGGLPGTNTADLEWNAVMDPNLSGYRVYVGIFSGTYVTSVDVGLATTYTVTGLGSGTYYFAVTAYDASMNESVYSNEIFTTFP